MKRKTELAQHPEQASITECTDCADVEGVEQRSG